MFPQKKQQEMISNGLETYKKKFLVIGGRNESRLFQKPLKPERRRFYSQTPLAGITVWGALGRSPAESASRNPTGIMSSYILLMVRIHSYFYLGEEEFMYAFYYEMVANSQIAFCAAQ